MPVYLKSGKMPSNPTKFNATSAFARTSGLARNATDNPAMLIMAKSLAPSPITIASRQEPLAWLTNRPCEAGSSLRPRSGRPRSLRWPARIDCTTVNGTKRALFQRTRAALVEGDAGGQLDLELGGVEG